MTDFYITEEQFATISAAYNPNGANRAEFYQNVYEVLQGPSAILRPDGTQSFAEGNVVAWFGAAVQANKGEGGASTLIRDYTQAQIETRTGRPMSDPAGELQTASNAIADAVFEDIAASGQVRDGQTVYLIPDAMQIGAVDATEAVRELPMGVEAWSGNPLFIGLGTEEFWVKNVLGGNSSNNFVGDTSNTYDLFVAVNSLISASFSSFTEIFDLLSDFTSQGAGGALDAGAALAAANEKTSEFLKLAYELGEIPLARIVSSNLAVGSESDDFSIEASGFADDGFKLGGAGDDLLVASFGNDIIDGGADNDSVSFFDVSANYSSENIGLEAIIYSKESVVPFSAYVSGQNVSSYLFSVERLSLGAGDDILRIEDFGEETTSLTEINAGRENQVGDTIDLSALNGPADLKLGEALLIGPDQLSLTVRDFENAIGTAGGDILEGTDANELEAKSGRNFIDGGSGNDVINGRGGNDELFGGNDNDTIDGSAGNDFLDGGVGADSIYGGGDSDVIVFDAADVVVDGGSGFDVGIFQSAQQNSPLQSDLTVTLEDLGLEMLVGGDGVNVLTTTSFGILAGGAADDTLIVQAPTQDIPTDGPPPDFGDVPDDDPSRAAILFGGGGADTFRMPAGSHIFVVSSDSLTHENFHTFRRDHLDSDINWGLIDVILINPDTTDTIEFFYDDDRANFAQEGLSGDVITTLNVVPDTTSRVKDDYDFYQFNNPVVGDDPEPDLVSLAWADTSDLLGRVITTFGHGEYLDGLPVVAYDFDTELGSFLWGGTPLTGVVPGNGWMIGGASIQGSTIISNTDGQSRTQFNTEGDDVFDATEFADLFQGGSGNDEVNGADEDDRLTFVSFDRGVFANVGTKTVSTGEDSETKIGGITNITGSAFADGFVGDAADNTFEGLAGNDSFDGGSGDDVLIAGEGNDDLTGGDGSDQFVFQTEFETNGDATDVVRDFDPRFDTLLFDEIEINSGQGSGPSGNYTSEQIGTTARLDFSLDGPFGTVERFIELQNFDVEAWAKFEQTTLEYDNGRVLVTDLLNDVRARSTMTDVADVYAWASYTDTYSDDGSQRTARSMSYDDGRELVSEYLDGVLSRSVVTDVADAYAWAEYTDVFDNNGLRAARDMSYDDGRTLASQYVDGVLSQSVMSDINDAYAWTDYTDTFDSAGLREARSMTYDDGRMLASQYNAGVLATSVMSDDGDAYAWSSYSDTFDNAGQRESRMMAYDDGRMLVSSYNSGIIAESTMTDDSDVYAWSNYIDTYDANGIRAQRVMTYDDGRVAETTYTEGVRSSVLTEDVSDAFVWADTTSTYAPDGSRLQTTTNYDNGRVLEIEFLNGVRSEATMTDVADAYSWAEYTDFYDEAGVRTSRELVRDDGEIVVTSFVDEMEFV